MQLRNMLIMLYATVFIVSEFMEEKITALSTFFRTTAMSSKANKKSAATIKTADLFVKRGTTKAPEKKSKKKVVVSSSESESSSEESSSEEEAPKKSKKKVEKKVEKKKGKKVVSSSESSSEDEDEIVVEQVAKKESVAVPLDGIAKLGEGLIAIASQFAESNALNARIMEKLIDVFAKMEAREEKEVGDDLLTVVEDVVKRGGSITIGSGMGADASYHFESVEHLRGSMGTLATQEDFSKVVDVLQDEEVEDNMAPLA